MRRMTEMGIRTYVSAPKQQGRRKWEGKAEEKAAVYANRRRVEGKRGKELLRRRGELLERPFAHQFETGAMRRVHVRGRENVAKRLLLQAAACNLALIMRTMGGAGTPRGLAELRQKHIFAFFAVLEALGRLSNDLQSTGGKIPAPFRSRCRRASVGAMIQGAAENWAFDTGC